MLLLLLNKPLLSAYHMPDTKDKRVRKTRSMFSKSSQSSVRPTGNRSMAQDRGTSAETQTTQVLWGRENEETNVRCSRWFHSEKLTSSTQQPHEVHVIASIVYMGKLRCRDLVNMPKDIQLTRLVWHQGPCSFTPLPINPVYKILIFIPWSSAKCLSPTLLDRFSLSLVCLPSEFIISPKS